MIFLSMQVFFFECLFLARIDIDFLFYKFKLFFKSMQVFYFKCFAQNNLSVKTKQPLTGKGKIFQNFSFSIINNQQIKNTNVRTL